MKAKIKDLKEISKLKKMTIEKINKEYNKKQLVVLKKDYSVNKIKRNIKNRMMFCLVHNHGILGVIDLKGNRIGGLFVKHNLIGMGYGRKLMRFIENEARKKGLKKVWLYSTPYALKLYKKLGYKTIDEGIWINKGVKFPEVRMEKWLK